MMIGRVAKGGEVLTVVHNFMIFKEFRRGEKTDCSSSIKLADRLFHQAKIFSPLTSEDSVLIEWEIYKSR